MERYPNSKLWMAFGGVVLLVGLSQVAERLNLLSGPRLVLQDAVSPGRLLLTASVQPHLPTTADSDVTSTLPPQIQQERRQLLIENARLRNQLRLLQATGSSRHDYRPLAGFDLVSARVLSHHGLPAALRPAMIDAGQAHGVTRSELVLDAAGIVLDQGSERLVDQGRPVLAGSAVIGRIRRTGRWVSELLPVTDPRFSARVRLVHTTARGTQMGAEAMLEGTGDLCQLVGVPETASVAIGDEVVSADLEGIAGPHLSYGTIIRADFQSAGEWLIHVRPIVAKADFDHVVIVVPRIDTARVNRTTGSHGSGKHP